MASEFLRGHIIHPLEYTTSDQQLAQIKLLLVELDHKLDVLTAIAEGQAEFQRQAALQLKVFEIQIGLLREHGGA